MSLWVIDKREWDAFVAKMMTDYRVCGPVAKGAQFAFDVIEEPADLRMDYNTSILPPKKYLQPQEERLMTFSRTGKTTVETVIESEPTVIMGVHTCDLQALRVLDAAFSQDYPDAHYNLAQSLHWPRSACTLARLFHASGYSESISTAWRNCLSASCVRPRA